MEKEVSLGKMRRLLWMMGIFKIPMIAFVKPKLIDLNDEKTVVKIKLKRRTKNHLNSMYFGALAVGADITAGLHAFYYAEKSGEKISFAFKSISGSFLKRPEGDVTFISEDGLIVKEVFNEALNTKNRINKEILVNAFSNKEKVATFVLEISVKIR